MIVSQRKKPDYMPFQILIGEIHYENLNIRPILYKYNFCKIFI